MVGALTQAINFPSETRKTFTLTINGQLNKSRNTKNSVKMAFNTMNAPALIMRNHSGLHVSNALDRALKPEVDFHSRIASKIYFRQAKPTRLAPKSMLPLLRFTKQTWKSLFHSQKEARRLGHDTIGTEDVLLGLIAESSGNGANVLNAMGITLEDARIATEKIGGRRSRPIIDQVTFSPRVFRLLQKAKSFDYYIGPEDLLLAIISEGEGAAAEVLESLNVDQSKIFQEVSQLIREKKDEFEDCTQGGFQESKMPKAEEYGTDFVKFVEEIIRTTGGKKEVDGTNLIKLAVGVGGGSGQSKMPTLEKWGTNLIKLAEEDELYPVTGREIEVQRVIEILDRHTKNNPWLIGEPGVGKTAIVDGLALMIADNNVPETLVGKKIIRLDMSHIVAGAESCGEFEERIKKLMEEIRQNDNIILFIDELQTSIGTGAAEGTIDAKNILKLALLSGLQCIVATTLDDYKKHIENDPALERRLQTVEVLEPSVEEAIEILRGLRELFEIFDKVYFIDDALVAAVELSNQYISDRFLPDKAIHLIKEAGAWVHLRALRLPWEAKDLEEEKRRVVREKNEASCSGYFGKAAILHIRELDLQSRMTAINSKCKEISKAGKGGRPTVTVADIGNVVSSWTGIPVEKVIGEKKALDGDGGEGSGESKTPTLEECVIDLKNILAKEVHGMIEGKKEAVGADDIGEPSQSPMPTLEFVTHLTDIFKKFFSKPT